MVSRNFKAVPGIDNESLLVTQSGSGAVERTVQNKFEDFVSVKDFGAAGDGVNDDTSAIQQAINTCRSQGRALFFPAGRYKITDTLTIFFNYGPNYPENQVVIFGIFGAGSHSTRIEWHGTTPITSSRRAMLILEGFCSISDIQFICPKLYGGSFSSITTPYYGVVMKNTAWRSTFKNVAIKYVHVPLSAGVIKNWNPSTYELEPVSGGSSLSVDYAQNTYINCVFTAKTHEFVDGTLNPASALNANGTNLAGGTANTQDLSTASFSDGSFVVEIARAQSVNNIFIGCQFEQNNPDSLGAIRVHDNSQTSFESCLIASGYGRIGIFCFCPTFTGPEVFTSKCYFIGNIAGWSSYNGLLSVTDGDGEWVRSSGPATPSSPADDIYLLCGANYGTSGFGAYNLLINSMTALRVSGYNKVFLLKSSTRTTTAASPTVTPSPRIKIDKLFWQGRIDVAGKSYGQIPSTPTSLAPDLPTILRDSTSQPENLPLATYRTRSAATRVNWSSRIVRDGRWFFSATVGSNNFMAFTVPIDPQGFYNISVDLWCRLQSGYTTADLTNGNLKCEVYWLSAADINTVVNGGTPSPVLLAANNQTLLSNNAVVTRVSGGVIPPTDAGWAEFRFESSGTSGTIVDEIGVGNFKIWDALSYDCTSLTSTSPEYQPTYDTGSFTPVITQVDGTPPTYTAVGSYVRIGKLMRVSMAINVTVGGSGASQQRISLAPGGDAGASGSGATIRADATFGAVDAMSVTLEGDRPCSAFVYEDYLLLGPRNNVFTGSQAYFDWAIGTLEVEYSYLLP